MARLSKHSYIKIVLKALKLFSFQELYFYMKLIFVKNVRNNNICSKIFKHLLKVSYRNRPDRKNFIKDFKIACLFVNQDEQFVINNITVVINNLKTNFRVSKKINSV